LVLDWGCLFLGVSGFGFLWQVMILAGIVCSGLAAMLFGVVVVVP
jgi:hypothetical protein